MNKSTLVLILAKGKLLDVMKNFYFPRRMRCGILQNKAILIMIIILEILILAALIYIKFIQ